MSVEKTDLTAQEVDLVRFGLLEVARDMNQSLMRSAFSPVVRDILDCTTAVHVKQGDGWEMVASREGCMQHAFTSQHICNFVMDEWDLDSLEPGDMIFVNDPWRGAIHQSDVNVLRPVHVDGEVLFVLHSTSHLLDLGGPIPGGFSNGARTAFEEQLKFPPTLLYANDVPVRPVFNYLLENVRVPAANLGDLRALAGCLVVGERMLRDVLDRYGLENVIAGADAALAGTEASMRKGLSEIPDGDYVSEDYLDDDSITDEKVLLQLALKIRGDRAEFDFSGTSRQPAGNVGTAWIESTRPIETIKMIVDPTTPVNGGTLRPFQSLLPAGSAVCVLPPSACSNHSQIGSRAQNLMQRNLAQALPGRGIACDTGTDGLIILGGIDNRAGREGHPWGTFAETGGGWGGTWKEDGLTFCIVPMGNCRTSVHEHAERESPVLVAQHEIMPDSAGAGRYRGGFGGVYTAVATADTEISINSDRVLVGAAGAEGGGTAMAAYAWYIKDFDFTKDLNPLDLRRSEPLYGLFDEAGRPDPAGVYRADSRYRTGKISKLALRAGDALRVVVGGGGGWGDPLERDVDRVARDVRNELYSTESARHSFGVVFDEDAPDAEATVAERVRLAELRAAGRWSVPAANPSHWIV